MILKELEELEKLTTDQLMTMQVAEFEGLFMYLNKQYKLATWRRLFNKKMLELFLPKSCEYKVTNKEAKLIFLKVEEIIKHKIKEGHVIRDPHQLAKRWANGKRGEYAFAKQLGYNYVDLEAFPLSRTGDIPDVLGLAGIKTSATGNFPVVYRRRKSNSDYPQIILVEGKGGTYHNTGIYHVEDLNAYTTDDLIKDRNMLQSKTAFYNYSRGLPFGNGLTNFYDAVSNVTNMSFSEVRAIGDAEIEKLEQKKKEQKDMPEWCNW